jgi:hypothetical protein
MKTWKALINGLVCAAFAGAILSASAFAQTSSSDIVGTVMDPAGSVVPDTALVLRNKDTNATLEAKSQSDGSYHFSQLVPGNYEITATAKDFKRFVAPDVILRVGTRTTVDVQLTVGDVTTTVEVTGSAKLVKPDDATIGQVITNTSITSLPLNGRNFIQLAQLSPGVTIVGAANSPSASWVGRADMGVVVAGLNERDTSYLLDGVETRSTRWGNSGFLPSVDAIAEFNIERNAFPADQGWGTTVVNTIIRSGSNQYHGTVFEFLRNNDFDARNFFDVGGRPPFHQNQFGTTFGGPIRKNRAFFFGDYEGFRQVLSNTYQGNFPTGTELGGQFSSTVIDPQTGQPFFGNKIPLGRFDTISKNVIPYFPTINRPGSAFNFYRTAATVQSTDQLHTKVDFNLPNNDHLFVRYSFVNWPMLQPGLLPGQGVHFPIADQDATVVHTHIFNPQLVNEFHLGYNRDRNFYNGEGFDGPNLAAQIGLQNTNSNPRDFGLPSFGLTGYNGIGGGVSGTLTTIDEIFQITDNLSYQHGRNDIKVGGEIRHEKLQFTGDFPSSPSFSFNGQYTGNPVGDFLLGLPSAFEWGVGSSTSNFRANQWAYYVEDNIKVMPKLTMSFGLRWEYAEPATEINDRLGFFNMGTNQFETVRGNHLQRGLFNPDKNNYAPRFGFAYSPRAKTVVRGGFGVYYDLVAGNEYQYRGLLNPPGFVVGSAINTLPVPTLSLQDQFPATPEVGEISPQTINPTDRTPYVYQYNMNVQQDLGGYLIEVGYVGSTGHKINRRFNNNIAPANPDVALADRVPHPGFGDILTSQNDGWSNYSGLDVKVEKPFSKGMLLLVAYTYGKAMDIEGPDEYAHRSLSSGPGSFKDMKGPSQIDTPQRFVSSYVYELPFGRGKHLLPNVTGVSDKFVSGWQLNGITTFANGGRFTPNDNWAGWANIGGRRIDPAICVGPNNSSALVSSIRANNLFPYFPVQNMLEPARGTMGNCGRGIIQGPGVNNWDLGLIKNTRVTEKVAIEFRAEFFNTWNHAQFAGLDVGFADSTYGHITSARTGRDVQFGMKVKF